jgi:hypothetical protein
MLLPLVILVGLGVVYVLVTHVQLIIFLHPPMPQNNPLTYNVVLQKDGKTKTYSSSGDAISSPGTPPVRIDWPEPAVSPGPVLIPPKIIPAPAVSTGAYPTATATIQMASRSSECQNYDSGIQNADLFKDICDVGDGLGLYMDDPAQCCMQCNKDTQCEAFVFGWGRCWMKNCGGQKKSRNLRSYGGLVSFIKKGT